jgi:hypothetical protein
MSSVVCHKLVQCAIFMPFLINTEKFMFCWGEFEQLEWSLLLMVGYFSSPCSCS